MISREYRGHRITLRRLVRSDGVPRWIATATVRTPYGPVTVAAVVGETVLRDAWEGMRRLAAARVARLVDAAGGQVEGIDQETWAELSAVWDEVGADEATRDVVRQIDQVIRDPGVQELASWIPFVNVAARGAALASGAAVRAMDGAPPAARAPAAPVPAPRPPAQAPRPPPAPAALPALPRRVARVAAAVGRARGGDPVALAALRAVAAQARQGDRTAAAVTELARQLAAIVPPMSAAAAGALRAAPALPPYAVPVELPEETETAGRLEITHHGGETLFRQVP